MASQIIKKNRRILVSEAEGKTIQPPLKKAGRSVELTRDGVCINITERRTLPAATGSPFKGLICIATKGCNASVAICNAPLGWGGFDTRLRVRKSHGSSGLTAQVLALGVYYQPNNLHYNAYNNNAVG